MSRIVALARIVRRIIGVPDYEVYLSHLQACHPDERPLTPEAFVEDTLVRRYEQPGSRCC